MPSDVQNDVNSQKRAMYDSPLKRVRTLKSDLREAVSQHEGEGGGNTKPRPVYVRRRSPFLDPYKKSDDSAVQPDSPPVPKGPQPYRQGQGPQREDVRKPDWFVAKALRKGQEPTDVRYHVAPQIQEDDLLYGNPNEEEELVYDITDTITPYPGSMYGGNSWTEKVKRENTVRTTPSEGQVKPETTRKETPAVVKKVTPAPVVEKTLEEKNYELSQKLAQLERDMNELESKLSFANLDVKKDTELKETVEKELTPVEAQEDVINQYITDLEQKERTATNPEQKRLAEKERWEKEVERRKVEGKKWKIQKQLDEAEKKLLAKQEIHREIAFQKEQLNRQIAQTKKEQEKNKISVLLRGIDKTKERIELEWIALNDRKKEITTRMEPILAKERDLEEKKVLLEQEEEGATSRAEEQVVEQKRWQIEKELKEIEEKRWAEEPELDTILKKIDKIKPEYRVALKEEEEAKSKLQNLDNN